MPRLTKRQQAAEAANQRAAATDYANRQIVPSAIRKVESTLMLLTHSQAIQAIRELLAEENWSPDTLDEIGTVVRATEPNESTTQIRPKDLIELECNEWFDRTYGNTYCSAQLLLEGNLLATMPLTSCNGSHAAYLACKWLVTNGYAPESCKHLWQIRDQLSAKIRTHCNKTKKAVATEHGRKRDGIPTF